MWQRFALLWVCPEAKGSHARKNKSSEPQKPIYGFGVGHNRFIRLNPCEFVKSVEDFLL
jgi:hypothetical protein